MIISTASIPLSTSLSIDPSLHPVLQTREITASKVHFTAGNSTFPPTIYTYKPYAGCHPRLNRRDGTPPRATFSTFATSPRPLLRLLPAPTGSTAFSSSMPTSHDLHPLRSGSIRPVSSPLRPTDRLNDTHSHKTWGLPTRYVKRPLLSLNSAYYSYTMLPRVLAPTETILEIAHHLRWLSHPA
jgi:hypothetical protein